MECKRIFARAAYAKDPTKARAAVSRWLSNNRERMREMVRNWDAANRPRKNEASAKRRAAVIRAMPAWADRKAILAIYHSAKEQGMHVDHILPLRGKLVCGLHVAENLQLLPGEVNRSKFNKFVVDDLSGAPV